MFSGRAASSRARGGRSRRSATARSPDRRGSSRGCREARGWTASASDAASVRRRTLVLQLVAAILIVTGSSRSSRARPDGCRGGSPPPGFTARRRFAARVAHRPRRADRAIAMDIPPARRRGLQLRGVGEISGSLRVLSNSPGGPLHGPRGPGSHLLRSRDVGRRVIPPPNLIVGFAFARGSHPLSS
jgi:hypothetical protein